MSENSTLPKWFFDEKDETVKRKCPLVTGRKTLNGVLQEYFILYVALKMFAFVNCIMQRGIMLSISSLPTVFGKLQDQRVWISGVLTDLLSNQTKIYRSYNGKRCLIKICLLFAEPYVSHRPSGLISPPNQISTFPTIVKLLYSVTCYLDSLSRRANYYSPINENCYNPQ